MVGIWLASGMAQLDDFRYLLIVGSEHKAKSDAVLPWASTFFALCLALSAGMWAFSGCQIGCESDLDCEGAGYCDQSTGRCERDCFTDEDCLLRPACRDNPVACQTLGLRCSGAGRCAGETNTQPGQSPETLVGVLTTAEGSGDLLGSGLVFVVDRLQVAGQGTGFDVNGDCDGECDELEGCPESCIDNRLVAVGQGSNDSIQNGIRNGSSIVMIELAGLDTVPFGFDDSFTVKIYGAIDADVPPRPDDNFAPTPGTTQCCKFKTLDRSPQGSSQAPAVLDAGKFRTVRTVDRIDLTVAFGSEPHPRIVFRNVLMSGRINSSLQTIETGLFGGAVPVSGMYDAINPFCTAGTNNPDCSRDTFGRIIQNSLLEHAVQFLPDPPDVDLDRDGVECLFDTDGDGRIDLCCEGDCSGRCENGRRVLGADETDPSSCADAPQMQDGYSIALTYTAVRAQLVPQ